jgi:hypothetical protein
LPAGAIAKPASRPSLATQTFTNRVPTSTPALIITKTLTANADYLKKFRKTGTNKANTLHKKACQFFCLCRQL